MYAKYIKRILDFTLALLGLIILSPVFLALIVAGAIIMGGNPFFVQKRPGKISKKTGQERIFSLIKFRTMTNKKDSEGKLLPDQERLVPYGKFLRSTSLDEIPSLVNILLGQLSIIGPRPLLIEYLPWYTERERLRHSVTPGLTGWAQINGRNTISWEEKFSFDLEYIENCSFAFDMKIIFLTFAKVVKRSDVLVGKEYKLGKFSEVRAKQLKEQEGSMTV